MVYSIFCLISGKGNPVHELFVLQLVNSLIPLRLGQPHLYVIILVILDYPDSACI